MKIIIFNSISGIVFLWIGSYFVEFCAPWTHFPATATCAAIMTINCFFVILGLNKRIDFQ
jgi:hypothetical protein